MNKLQMKYEKEIREMVSACHRLAELGYVTSSGGNLSLRVEDNLLLITPTKTPKRSMGFNDICAVDLQGNVVFAADNKKPTGETFFHTRIMRARPNVSAIAHAHPPILTGFAIANSDLLSKPFLPEATLEVGPMLMVPYETPVSEALSKQFDQVIHRSNGFLMENHGAAICSVNSIYEAVEFMQMVECMAQSVLVSIQLGNCKSIPKSFVKELDHVIAMRNLALPCAPGTFSSLVELYGLEDEA
jgi:ribulose-5-phosphate 4-epimerase/fuculose-1-phosphate aldolase